MLLAIRASCTIARVDRQGQGVSLFGLAWPVLPPVACGGDTGRQRQVIVYMLVIVVYMGGRNGGDLCRGRGEGGCGGGEESRCQSSSIVVRKIRTI